MTATPGWRRALRTLLDVAAVAATVGFIASYFPRDVMFAPTTTNGGDMGSHFYPAVYLRDVLLPKHQIVGWFPGNYCGFPLFQFYFPLPFLVVVAMSAAMPITVAFKLGTVLGTLLLPICTYAGLRLARVAFPGPALGAVATLPFLFMEANSMWGGNIPSTLAGEFSLSLGLALTVLFFGALRRTAASNRGSVPTGVLLAAIGLAHGYTLLWAGFSSMLELVTTHGWWRRVGVLFRVNTLAILLMAGWLVPLLAYAPWTTAYNHSWPIQSWREVLPPILWIPAGIAVATTLVELVIALVRRTAFPRGLAMLWGAILVAGFFYELAYSFHVVDIRFVPFVQLGLCLIAGAGLGTLLGRMPTPEIWPVVGVLATLPAVQSQVGFIPSWIRWNYSGFEKKATWPTLKRLSDELHGTFADPRVVYEHTPENESLGTVRVFESLPLFSGRSTLEGLYMQGSPTAPFVFYIQSEVSKNQSCPFPDWGCTRLDMPRGLHHLEMLNVSQFIARSPEVKAALAALPGSAVKESTAGSYEIWRLKNTDGRYAIPLATMPYLVVTDHWKEDSYNWFKQAKPGDPTPVFVTSEEAADGASFAGVVHDVHEVPPPRPIEPVAPLRETMDTDRIVIEGARPGQPILVRISYHPRWKALTGEKIWLAGPSFMLVFPKSERVELFFGDGPPVVFGRIASLLGVLLVVVGLVPATRRAGDALRAAASRHPPGSWIASTAAWSDGRRRAVFAVGLAAAAIALAVFAWVRFRIPADQVYRAAQRKFDAGDLAGALSGFQAVQEQAPLAAIAIHSNYFEGIIHVRRNEWTEAESVFQRLLKTYPDAPNAPEAQYHVGLSRISRGDRAGAIEAWRVVPERYPDSPWAGYAKQRLTELGAG